MNRSLNLKLFESRLELYFQVKEIDIQISDKNNGLEILLESENVPAKKECISLIEKILTESQESQVDIVKVYGCKRQEHFPEWTTELTIGNDNLNLKLFESRLELYFQVKRRLITSK